MFHFVLYATDLLGFGGPAVRERKPTLNNVESMGFSGVVLPTFRVGERGIATKYIKIRIKNCPKDAGLTSF